MKLNKKNGLFILTFLVAFTITAKAQENEQFTPEILNPGFDIEGDMKFRGHWINKSLGGGVQVSKGPVYEGLRSGKFPADGTRIAYQVIVVEKNKNYKLSFFYTMKPEPKGTLTVAILSGDVNDIDQISKATINSVVLNDQEKQNAYVPGSVSFNSGDNDEIAIFVSNIDAEARIDSFTIVEE